MISTELLLNGRLSCQLSLVASKMKTWQRLESKCSFCCRISIARGEKSQPNTCKLLSLLYFNIGRMVFPTPQPISKILNVLVASLCVDFSSEKNTKTCMKIQTSTVV